MALVLVRGMAVAQVAGPDTIRVVYPDDTVAVRLHSADPADPTLQSLWEADPTPTLSKAHTKGKEKRQRRDWSQWRPEAKRAMWLAWYCREPDRSITANTGSCPSSMAGSQDVSTP